MKNTPKPVVLCILDGWGYRELPEDNAIAQARTPHWDALWANYPHGVLNASEGEVGLPCGQMGNSEVGHMNIGAGRVVLQDLPRIDSAIENGSLANNITLRSFINRLKSSGGACHLLGLLSDGGVHSHQQHMLALAQIVSGHGIAVYVHAFLDGRDTPPRSAEGYLEQFESAISADAGIRIATISGRYYAMDRDKRWDRVEKAYHTLVDAAGDRAATAQAALERAYHQLSTNDEFVMPCPVGDYHGMHDGDGVLMANFRADRAREILTALTDPAFHGFERNRAVSFAALAGMVEYSTELASMIPAIFEPESLDNILPEIIAKHGLRQLRIAETEKYAHVTFFLSGGREEPYIGEDRILVPSPNVATYDLKPEMSAYEVTEKLVEAISRNRYDVIIVNYANTDMVGHSGDLSAAIKAVEAVDACLGQLKKAVEDKGGVLIISADHGNAEMMTDHSTGQAHTAHTLNLVPVLIVGHAYRGKQHVLIREGRLADLAPTVLDVLHIPKPLEMTGVSLLPDELKHERVSA